MKSYLIIHKQTGSKMMFKFNLNSNLTHFDTSMNVTDKTITFLEQVFPFTLEKLNYFKTHKDFRVEEVQMDLSFKTFWDTYYKGYPKLGNKKRAERLWNLLNAIDRAKALNYIPTYNNILINNVGQQRLYAETYLYQRRFDNE